MEVASKLLYQTFSLCPKCTLLEKETNLILKKAEVQEKQNGIWLSVKCNIHGLQDTLLTKNIAWYHKMWQLNGQKPADSSLRDIEDLKKKKRLRSDNLPFINEISIFEHGHFISESDIDNQLRKIQSRYGANDSFVLKITGNLATDIAKLNQAVLYIYEHTTPNHYLMVHVTVERLLDLSALNNSCFAKSRIYPNVKYFLRKGDEKLCMDEFVQTTIALKSFKGCQLVVSLNVEYPMPDLTDILAYLRVQRGFVRFVEIIIQRESQKIVENISNKKTMKRDGSGNTYEDALDPYEVLSQIEALSEKSLKVDDFYPLGMGSVIEPFLPIIGYPKYKIRPSPHCGYCACLINSEKYFSTPLTRILNFEKFYLEIQPLLPDMLKSDIGFFSKLQLHVKLGLVIKNSLLPGADVDITYLLSFLTDKNKMEETQEFVKNMQFFIIHNHMDVAMVDMVRRCQCSSLAKTNEGLDFYASCTGCL